MAPHRTLVFGLMQVFHPTQGVGFAPGAYRDGDQHGSTVTVTHLCHLLWSHPADQVFPIPQVDLHRILRMWILSPECSLDRRPLEVRPDEECRPPCSEWKACCGTSPNACDDQNTYEASHLLEGCTLADWCCQVEDRSAENRGQFFGKPSNWDPQMA